MLTFLFETQDINGGFNYEMAFELHLGGIIAILCVVLAIIAGLYLLRSFGIYTLAKRQQIDKAYLAWIPCAWIYTLCKIIGKVKTFNTTFKKLALIFMIIFIVAQVFTVTYNVFAYYPLVGNLIIGGRNVYMVLGDTGAVERFVSMNSGYTEYWTADGFIYDSSFVWPYSPSFEQVVRLIVKILSFASLILDVAVIVITVDIYIALFKKFWPQHYVLASVLSFFGLFPIMVFLIRKKDAINYEEYMRARASMYYYGRPPYGTPYGSPYNNSQAQRPPEHPFPDFAERGEVDPGDPFEEFSDKKNNSENNPFSEFDKDDKN